MSYKECVTAMKTVCSMYPNGVFEPSVENLTTAYVEGINVSILTSLLIYDKKLKLALWLVKNDDVLSNEDVIKLYVEDSFNLSAFAVNYIISTAWFEAEELMAVGKTYAVEKLLAKLSSMLMDL